VVQASRAAAQERCQAAEELVKQSRLEDAIAEYDEALRVDPSYVCAYTGRAVAHLSVGDAFEALRDYDDALRLEPEFAGAYAGRAVALIVLRKDAEAQRDIEQAVELGVNRDEIDQVVSGIRSRRKN
jgi:Tfp pilus assembly protein PilF